MDPWLKWIQRGEGTGGVVKGCLEHQQDGGPGFLQWTRQQIHDSAYT